MDSLQFHINDQIDHFAKQYENAPITDDLIKIKVKFQGWLDKHIQAIQNYYSSDEKEDKISFVCSQSTFKLRLTFYKRGHVQILIEHINSRSSLIEDRTVMSRYCMDAGYVYFIESEFGWKIGKTRDIKRRKNIFEVKLPFHFAMRFYIKTPQMSNLEKDFHKYFKSNNINGEWFLITEDQIKECVVSLGSFKLRPCVFHRNVIIDKKYLTQIQ